MLIECPRCNGTGEVTVRHWSDNPELDQWYCCGLCHGDGEIEADDEDDAQDKADRYERLSRIQDTD